MVERISLLRITANPRDNLASASLRLDHLLSSNESQYHICDG